MNSQLRLDLGRPPAYRDDAFVTSAANREAVAMVMDRWLDWPGHVMALVGPEGVGKTHLARMWAAAVGAKQMCAPFRDVAIAASQPVLVENVDLIADEEGLFHLINSAAHGGALLLTARALPTAWPAGVPDLRSRFNALVVAEIGEPDDAILTGILQDLFAQRNIRPADDLIPYVLPRMERSAAAARRLVEALDEAAAQKRREINRTLAVQVLEVDSVTSDLF